MSKKNQIQTVVRLLVLFTLWLVFASELCSAADVPGVKNLIAQGDELIDDDRIDEAIDVYRRAIAENPTSSEAYQRLGQALRYLGDHEGAFAQSSRAIELNANNALAHSTLGWAFGMEGRYREAAREELIAIGLDPEHAASYLTLGLALTSLGDYDGAITANRKALELDPENLEAFNALGAALGRKGDSKGAATVYRKALQLNDHSFAAHLGLARALGNIGDLAGQIEHYKAAVEIAPSSDRAHGGLGWALSKSGDWQGALKEGCITNWLRLKKSGPQYLQNFIYIWAGVFLLFGLIFAVIFLGSWLTPQLDEIVIKSYFLTFFRGEVKGGSSTAQSSDLLAKLFGPLMISIGRFVITNKRVLFVPEIFSKWFGAKTVAIERNEIESIDSAVLGMRGALLIRLKDGTSYQFFMPNLVLKPLKAQLAQAGERARIKRTTELVMPLDGLASTPTQENYLSTSQSQLDTSMDKGPCSGALVQSPEEVNSLVPSTEQIEEIDTTSSPVQDAVAEQGVGQAKETSDLLVSPPVEPAKEVPKSKKTGRKKPKKQGNQ